MSHTPDEGVCPWWMVGQVCRLCSRHLLEEDLVTFSDEDRLGVRHVVHLACYSPAFSPRLFNRKSSRYVETCIIGMLVLSAQRKLTEVQTAEYILAELKSYGVMVLSDE